MSQPISYELGFTSWTRMVLTLHEDRLVCERPGRKLEAPLSAIRHFCLEPQALMVSGQAWDAVLFLAVERDGKKKIERITVAMNAPGFRRVLDALAKKRPDASLLHLPPKEALRQMGVWSTLKMGLVVAAAIIVGVGGAAAAAILLLR
jgi:hypothetical protein